MSENYPTQYPGLVLGVVTYFETLTKLYNKQVHKIEEEKIESVKNSIKIPKKYLEELDEKIEFSVHENFLTNN